MERSNGLVAQTTSSSIPKDKASGPAVGQRNPVRGRTLLILGAVGIAALLVVGLFAFLVLSPATGGPRGPSLGPGGLERTAPDTVGCLATALEVCYTLTVGCTIANLPASNLFFATSSASAFSYPIPNNARLGPGATVTVLNGTSSNGVWNVTNNRWTILPGGDVPVSTPLILVLDTGVVTNTTLQGEWFFVEHSAPSGGYLGFALGYA